MLSSIMISPGSLPAWIRSLAAAMLAAPAPKSTIFVPLSSRSVTFSAL